LLFFSFLSSHSQKFKANPYFDNKELFREFEIEESGLKTVTPVPIQWKAGKRLTEMASPASGIKKKRRHEEISGDSFFGWFDPEIPLDENSVEDIANWLLDELWADAFKYYQGVREISSDIFLWHRTDR